MEYMKFIFYGLAAWGAVVFFRAFFKAGKRQRGSVKDAKRMLTSFIETSLSLPDGGRVLPNHLFQVLAREQLLAELNLCFGKRLMLGRPKDIWHLKEKQTAVPSFSLTVTGEQLEVSIIAEAEYATLLAQSVLQALQSADGAVTLKCPLLLIVHASGMDQADQVEIEVGKFQFSNDVLKIEIPEIALSLTLNVNSSTQMALIHALDVAGRCA